MRLFFGSLFIGSIDLLSRPLPAKGMYRLSYPIARSISYFISFVKRGFFEIVTCQSGWVFSEPADSACGSSFQPQSK